MAQYDVFVNPSRSADSGVPYVVVIQSDLLEGLATRLTIPLAIPDADIKAPPVLCPRIEVKGQSLLALTHFTAPLPAKLLRRPVANVAAYSSVLIAALDAVLTGV